MEKNNKSDKFKKMSYIGGFGAILGAAVGAYISEARSDDTYLVFYITGGIILGLIIGLIFNRSLSVASLQKTSYKANFLLSIVAFCLAIAGLIGFLKTGQTIGIAGAIFFALGGIFLVKYRGDW